jgi:hypothetical protein
MDAASRSVVAGEWTQAIYELTCARRAIELAITETIHAARDDPDEVWPTWLEIGAALGVSKQAAQQRFGS